MKNVVDFFIGALPWLIIGIGVAIVIVKMNDEKSKDTYYLEGMCMGMIFSSTISIAAHLNLGLCLPIGLLFGMAMGSSIKRK